MGHPISTVYLDVQEARAFSVLPAVGAWDANPIEMACPSFDFVLFYLNYIEGEVVGGAVDIRIDISTDSTGTAWHQGTAYSTGAVAGGGDTSSLFQRENITYEPTTTDREYFVFGPVALNGTVERIRVVARESGQMGTPGWCQIEARFQ